MSDLAGFRTPPSGADDPIVPWRVPPRTVLMVGLASWVLCYAVSQATVSDAGLPAMFLPAGIGVGLLLRLPTSMWWIVLASMAGIDILGGTATGIAPAVVAMIWGASNVTQTLLIALTLRWTRVDMTRTRDPVVLAVAAALIVAVVSVTGSVSLAVVSNVDAEQFWADWWGSDVLSIVLVVPVVLLIGRASPPRGRSALAAVGWLLTTGIAVALEFSGRIDTLFPVWLWLILGAPLVVLYGVRYGLLAMSVFLLVLDFVAVTLTAMGQGPFQELALSATGTPLRSLQLVLIVLAVSVQSVSLLVYHSLRHGRTVAAQQALLDAVIEGSPVATAILDPRDGHRLMRANAAFRELLPAASAGVSLLDCVPDSERADVTRLFSATAAPSGTTGEFAVCDIHGEPVLLQLRVAAVAADTFDKYGTLRRGATAFQVVHAQDMTDVRRRENRLRHDAVTDPLTGLANRRQLLHHLEQALTEAAPGHIVAVAYIDLDGFKNVNDRSGHHAGDQVLREVAQCLSSNVRTGDLVARTGGDEFVVVSQDLPEAASASYLAERLLRRLLKNPSTSGLVAASMGVAVCDDPSTTPDDLLQRADAQMYRAKSSGGARVAGTF